MRLPAYGKILTPKQRDKQTFEFELANQQKDYFI